MKKPLKKLGIFALTIAAIGCAAVLVNHPVTPPVVAPQIPEAHASQALIRDMAIGFIEVSAERHVATDNPQGWDRQYGFIEKEGWGCLLPRIRLYAKSGYKAVGLWEPGGNVQKGDPCMAWINPTIVAERWSDTMRLSWQGFLAECRALGVEPIWYLGCAGNHLDTINEDLAWCASMGLKVIGLDAFSWTVYTDPRLAVKVIDSLRSDPRTADLCLITEGWLPDNLTDADHRYFLIHLAQLEVIENATDEKWARIKPEAESLLVSNGVRLILVHGPWNEDQAPVYERIKATGSQPVDWRLEIGEWK